MFPFLNHLCIVTFVIIVTNYSIFKPQFEIDNKNIKLCKGGLDMLSYAPLWETMEKQNVSTYTLISKHGINPRTINNLKHDKSITMYTLERLCHILHCTPNDIVKFTEE